MAKRTNKRGSIRNSGRQHRHGASNAASGKHGVWRGDTRRARRDRSKDAGWVLKWREDGEYLHKENTSTKVPRWGKGRKGAFRYTSSKSAWGMRATWPANLRKYIQVMRLRKVDAKEEAGS